jgi:hypothetical protein
MQILIRKAKYAGPMGSQSLFSLISIICSSMAILILVFLVIDGFVQSSSPANISIFMGLLYLDIFLVLTGVILGILGLRRTRNLRLVAILLLLIYLAFLIILIEMIYL